MDLLLVDSVYLSWDFRESFDVGGGMIKTGFATCTAILMPHDQNFGPRK